MEKESFYVLYLIVRKMERKSGSAVRKTDIHALNVKINYIEAVIAAENAEHL